MYGQLSICNMYVDGDCRQAAPSLSKYDYSDNTSYYSGAQGVIFTGLRGGWRWKMRELNFDRPGAVGGLV